MIVTRKAVEADQPEIRALVAAARINTTNLDWRRFRVAHDDGIVVGCAQIRHHADGGFELASLAVAPDRRGRGIGTRLIAELLADFGDRVPLHVITDRPHAGRYGAWGFRLVPPRQAPGAILRTFRIGRAITFAVSLFSARPIRLVLMRRDAA